MHVVSNEPPVQHSGFFSLTARGDDSRGSLCEHRDLSGKKRQTGTYVASIQLRLLLQGPLPGRVLVDGGGKRNPQSRCRDVSYR